MTINLPNYERQTIILQNTEEIKNVLPLMGKTPRRQIFTENGTWKAPAGVTRVFVTGGGAGGGGGAAQGASNTFFAGTAGGATSFGTLLTLTGGGGGVASSNFSSGSRGAPGGNGGRPGSLMSLTGSANGLIDSSLGGGDSGIYFGGAAMDIPGRFGLIDGGKCSGGGPYIVGNAYVGGGGGGEYVDRHPLSVVPGTTYNITIGVGGKGGTNHPSSADRGGNGGNGILTIEWWE